MYLRAYFGAAGAAQPAAPVVDLDQIDRLGARGVAVERLEMSRRTAGTTIVPSGSVVG